MTRRVDDGTVTTPKEDRDRAITEVDTAVTRAAPVKLRRLRVELPPLARGERIGRYIVIDVLGRGGMGIVYLAYDPDLDRRIAVKVLRPTDTSDDSGLSAGRERLLREAQALAQLSHPNVVSVYDVGVANDDVFVAMELVEGDTLRTWVTKSRPPIREVVRVFVAAGEGLAAAHDAGMVHRDFKPGNVMVGASGRVRVLDFGLVRTIEGEPSTPSTSSSERDDDVSTGGSSLTRADVIVGTPPYMAPEQFRKEGADALSDQYSFCVSLFEMLYGSRPFPGSNRRVLREDVLAGNVVVPDGVKVPPRLARIVRRGMSPKPEERYPSMHALLDDLRRDPARGRRRVAAALGVLVLAGAAFALARPDAQSPAARCETLRGDLDDVWNHDVAARLTAAFEATGKPFASDSASRVVKGLDDYRRRWGSVRVEACSATHVHATQSDELLDLRMECLDRRHDSVASLLAVLVDAPSGDVVANAVDAVDGLPGLERCSDAEALRAVSPLPEESAARADIASLRRELDEVEALSAVGRYVDALPPAEVAAERSRELGYPPTRVEAFALLAQIQEVSGDVNQAEPAYKEELRAAAVVGDPRVLAQAWIEYVDFVGNTMERYDQALAFAEAADVAVISAGEPARERAYLLTTVGEIRATQGDSAGARETLQRALSLRERSVPDDLVGMSITLDKAASAAKLQGDYDAARGYLRRSIALSKQRFGPHHAKVGALIFNLALVEMASGDYKKALGLFDEARTIVIGAIGDENPNVATMLTEAANCMIKTGRTDGALENLQRAQHIREKAFGPNHRMVANSLQSIGELMITLGREDEAAPLLERALRIREDTFGKQHPLVGESLAAIAGLYWSEGRVANARAYYERTRDIYAAAYGKEHPFYAVMMLNLGDCDLDLGRPAHAVPFLEEAVAVLRKSQSAPGRIADAEVVLAKALWRSGRDRKRARELARTARGLFSEAGDSEQVAEVDAWLAKPR